MKSVLFIGVGRMGGAMASHLVAAGVPVSVVDLDEAALAPFRARGIAVSSRAEGMEGELVITMLPTERQVREALLGPGGACLQAGRRVVVDMSTSSPGATRALAQDLDALGIALLDAPVSGGMSGARDGTLVAMAGGAPEIFDAVLPYLRAFCQRVDLVGPVGCGHAVKALNNFLSAVTLWSTGEALVIGQRLGLDPEAMLKVWTAGSGRSHASEVKLPKHVLTGRYDFGQTMELFCKDIAIAEALAVEAGVETPSLDRISSCWRDARDRLGGGADITEVMHIFERSQRNP